jgi:hypothetical protein
LNREARKATLSGVTDQAAYLLRENTGTSGVMRTAQTAVATLAADHIPHLIVGGVAVQEHGYPRVTVDLELILRRKLARDLPVAQAVRPLYLETWDALQAES